jgi:hypothetical protein
MAKVGIVAGWEETADAIIALYEIYLDKTDSQSPLRAWFGVCLES